jgi:hypothetical protein
MGELSFECVDVVPERYGVAPTLLFRLRITEHGGDPIHSIALRCQIRIEPQRREYDESEQAKLADVFGERSRWGQTLRPMQFASVSVLVPGFTGSTEVEVAVPCSYDMEVASGKYFHALERGSVPVVLLFSGTVFGKGDKGFWVRQVPWDDQAMCAMPVTVWQELMNLYFPRSSWLRLHHDTMDALLRYKARHAIPTWDDTIVSLLDAVGEETP